MFFHHFFDKAISGIIIFLAGFLMKKYRPFQVLASGGF
jgi:hypothetical protein